MIVLKVAVALLVFAAMIKLGFMVLGSFARPVPAAPPPGELRKVRLVYRCGVCSTEVRMTAANDQVPEPPRHCMEDMDLITNLEDV